MLSTMNLQVELYKHVPDKSETLRTSNVGVGRSNFTIRTPQKPVLIIQAPVVHPVVVPNSAPRKEPTSTPAGGTTTVSAFPGLARPARRRGTIGHGSTRAVPCFM